MGSAGTASADFVALSLAQGTLSAQHAKLCSFGMAPLDEDRLCRLRELILRVRVASNGLTKAPDSSTVILSDLDRPAALNLDGARSHYSLNFISSITSGTKFAPQTSRKAPGSRSRRQQFAPSPRTGTAR